MKIQLLGDAHPAASGSPPKHFSKILSKVFQIFLLEEVTTDWPAAQRQTAASLRRAKHLVAKKEEHDNKTMKTQSIRLPKSLLVVYRNCFRALALVALFLPMLLVGLSRAADIVSDQADYAPRSTAIFTGSGFQPDETITLRLWRADGTPASAPGDGPWQAVADAAGAFSGSWAVCQQDCPGTTLVMVACGDASGLSAQAILSVEALPPTTYVTTDRSDYPPGATANIMGVGFQPGENVVLQVLHADGTPDTGADHAPWAVVADASGAFQTTWHVCEDDCLGSTLRLSAVGQTSGLSAYAYFTDACPSGGGEVDLTFDPGSAANNTVQSVTLQPDGKVLIGGLFTIVNDAVRGGIARLNADGSTDLTFLNSLAGAAGEVHSVAVQADGKVLIGGTFTAVNGVSRNRLARLNTDGNLDTSFQNGMTGPNNTVLAMDVQSDGQVLIETCSPR